MLADRAEMPHNPSVKAKQFLRKLQELGVEIIEGRGKGSHVLVKYRSKKTTVPFHKGRDLDRNFVKEICKQLGLDPNDVL